MANRDLADLIDTSNKLSGKGSISPPSTPPASNRPSIFNDQKFLGMPVVQQVDNLKSKNKRIEVFYWTNYDEGECLQFEYEVARHLISDLKEISVTFFTSKLLDRNLAPLSSDNFIIRPANRSGKPKNDMPMLDNK
jgi:hypothetical protein